MELETQKPHKKLEVWKKSIDLAVRICGESEKFPNSEQYGLTSQLRRAAVSIASNIAEGAARQTKKEFINFLHMAQGSLSEIDTQLIIANKIGYLASTIYNDLYSQLTDISKMLTGLIRSIKRGSETA